MSISAIIMMTATWGIVTFITLRFFIKVIRTPQKKD